ncbi:MAG: nitronate monooxygenase [Opitutus sp.]|nr:nitronate monooxygenase [Opitutus sp.]MSU51538.1 nitronate monooxygenase [Opitutus sp.]
MSSDRRAFLQTAGLVTLGLGLRGASTLSAQAPAAMPTDRAKALMAKFGLKCPIFQAGMAILAPPELAAAVSNAGGLGAIGLTGATPERGRELVAQTKAATKRPFAVNYILVRDCSSFRAAVEAGAPIVQFSWGLPSREQLGALAGAGTKWGVQVASGEGAARAVDLGVDYIICQGTEAGGHVQAIRSREETLPEVLAAAKSTPVLAAGGIASGRAIRRALLDGAAGVLMGTRFMATREAYAHDVYKAALTRAKAEDSVFTICFQDGWTSAPHRVLRNRTLNRWEAAGCPPPGQRPGEGEVVATTPTGVKRLRYAGTSPRPGDTGEVAEMAMWAGVGVGSIRDVAPAAEIVERLWAECLNA